MFIKPYTNVLNELDHFYDKFFENDNRNFPFINLYSNENNLVITAELPGLNPEDLEINVKNNILSISGELREDVDSNEELTYYFKERKIGKFERKFKLPVTVETDKIQANLSNGTLKIELPIKEEEKPKQIKVTIN